MKKRKSLFGILKKLAAMIKHGIGETIWKAGCFTFEAYIQDCQLYEIGHRLGLPNHILKEGVYIAYALDMPDDRGFELGGVTYDSTDNFVDYSTGKPLYDAKKFLALYPGLNLKDMKQRYRDVFAENKLVKVISKADHHVSKYPAGTIIPQFIMTKPLTCMVAAYIPRLGTFRQGGLLGMLADKHY
jgi:hypothetical protein